ncbi:Di-glucose binding within endoplasmic reticulum [Haladaptatus litoreus]|uniref:Di-glucose binding within endoplasmic reticulum n=1 Tax=Haladaptatus litoreus TaxID=553468 RepID=A0A1N6YVG6_9EURY|nr:malectin domain-containing carbohydrate-binding protein [Haladaptatus litoreus]SIR18623.1 Di-glucose binding within endoplasmic reticulum [Haladaptatus litoreus]
MSGASSGGFIHGALIGGGLVFFVAGMIIVAGIPGILGSSPGGMDDGTTTVEPTPTSTQATETTEKQSTTDSAQSTTQQPQTTQTTTPPTTQTTTAQPSEETVRYRVNVGGQRIAMSDGGPDWEQDSEQRPSRFGNARQSGSHTNTTSDQIATTPSVPSGTPEAVFQSRRYDADNPNDFSDNTEMQYRFPVEDGRYVVRLYFVESYFGNSGWNDYDEKGPRKFDVEIEGQRVLDDYDMYEELGHDRGTVKSFAVEPQDGAIDVRFIHEIEDPMLSGIEVVRVDGNGNAQNDRTGNGDGDWNNGNDENDGWDDGDWQDGDDEDEEGDWWNGANDDEDDSAWDGSSEISSPDSTPALSLTDSTLETPTRDVRPVVAHEFRVPAASQSS